MSLATFNELQSRLGSDFDSDEDVMSIVLAAATSAIETYCNSYFGRRASRVIPGESASTLVCPGHSLVTGDYVTLSGMYDSDLDGTHQVTVIQGAVPSFSVPVGSAETQATGLIRKRVTKVFSTRGGDVIYLNPRPVGSVTQVRTSTSPNVFTSAGVMATTDYMLELDGDNHSVSGALYRLYGEWPYAMSGKLSRSKQIAHGAVEVQFLPGAPVMPADLIDAAIQFAAVVTERGSDAQVASESLEYYSYSLLTGDAAKSVPDSVMSALVRHRRIAG